MPLTVAGIQAGLPLHTCRVAWGDDAVVISYAPEVMSAPGWIARYPQMKHRAALASLLRGWDLEGSDGRYEPHPLTDMEHWEAHASEGEAPIDARALTAYTEAWQALLDELPATFCLTMLAGIIDDYTGGN